ncbi:ribulokinase [Rhodonellum psychrophilum GCM71 = DSM 17998]|uniref:Ribulokinase n=2 Tax=Rhodonellum TaxID=336827 RepID=U5C0F1_9BACT|nr:MULTISPECIES: ribulokinase [Rhodonellum]ERM83568.1 ribulokinase [Rhodonellum psychrophilum GCM71 = DSM 17998]SDY53275.1 L-ribulokinase [Rhodonellum ikkaensis]
MNDKYVIGLDYGSDSVRAVLVNTSDGNCLASHVYWYPRWKEGKYCDPISNRFRQHPLDHLEGLEQTIKGVLSASGVSKDQVRAICVDTTGSSPMPVDEKGQSLALKPEFADNPNAMMVIWKDHTAIKEADEINEAARTWGGEDFTKYEGGIYSSEWFWAKILHVIREDEAVKNAAFSWMEHCDFITAQLIGCEDPLSFKRSRCAAGHKALWHASWGGLPPKEFLGKFDPYLTDLKDRLYTETYTSDEVAGHLSKEWAEKLGLSEDTVIAVGTFDAHAGAVGGEITENTLVKVMGTSTCDIMVTHKEILGDKLISGICGQVDGSVIPGTIGLEAGQSGFGDVLAWFKNLIVKPSIELIQKSTLISGDQKEQLIAEIEDQIIIRLSDDAIKIPVSESKTIALDWINGRRTPDANQALKGAIRNLNMGTDAPRVFKALVESICFGSRKIVDRFREEGIQIDAVIGLGGVAKKSNLVMQTMADILNMPIKIATSEQAPALGAAMYAAVAAGIHPSTQAAIQAMSNGFDKVYEPIEDHVAIYESLYQQYIVFGSQIEETTK